ncbi:MAG: PD-(D/E)XK nuclease family transposase [Spirochaetaceae bacterium]|jgi:predicted transposase/invertase (TIGR01784 family)|nr:PD-(D/E)XK nuclease family transposase [Spirochaetaceae bacterium]
MAEFNPQEPLSPLADPVIGAIFCDVEHAGAAVASLAGAVFAKDDFSIGRIVSVTPQRYYKIPGERGVCIDIEGRSDQNEYAIIEIQINTDPSILLRNLLGASRIYAAKVPEGTHPRDLVKMTPKVLAINILDYSLRDTRQNKDYVQPVKLLYTKPPQETALTQFAIYNIELPKFREAAADFGDKLYCWIYALEKAHREKKTVEEVIKMTPQLQGFAKEDEGFRQFCEQYHRVASDPATRNDYYWWWIDMARKDAEINYGVEKGHAKGLAEGRAEGLAEGRAEGLAEGRMEATLEAAKAILALGHTPEEVAKALQLPLADVKALQ